MIYPADWVVRAYAARMYSFTEVCGYLDLTPTDARAWLYGLKILRAKETAGFLVGVHDPFVARECEELYRILVQEGRDARPDFAYGSVLGTCRGAITGKSRLPESPILYDWVPCSRPARWAFSASLGPACDQHAERLVGILGYLPHHQHLVLDCPVCAGTAQVSFHDGTVLRRSSCPRCCKVMQCLLCGGRGREVLTYCGAPLRYRRCPLCASHRAWRSAATPTKQDDRSV